ncbi:MAG: hypothetical protein ACFFB2_09880 [Promethearchaeota archaeon]
MKMSKTLIFIIFLLTLNLGTLPVIAESDLPIKSIKNIKNNQTVDILHVTKIDSTISIIMDYDLNSTSQLATNESLVVLVIFSITTDENLYKIQAAMLFFHTGENQYFMFWMLGDPYKQAQDWQSGVKNEHFEINGDQLTLTFIEFLNIGNPEIETTVIAKLAFVGEVSVTTINFRPILDQFIAELPISYEIPSIGSSSSEEAPGAATPGFTILSIASVAISVFLSKRRK